MVSHASLSVHTWRLVIPQLLYAMISKILSARTIPARKVYF